MITDEKRAFKRVKKKFSVRYCERENGRASSGSAVSENISLGGVFFISIESFDIGCVLDCRIKIPGREEECVCVGRVVRCQELEDKMVKTYGVAVEFIEYLGNGKKFLKGALKDA